MSQSHIFQGLSGFPITPIKNGRVDTELLIKIRDCIDTSGLDSIGVLGSTGSFAYLDKTERTRVLECWSGASTPWIAGVSASTTQLATELADIAAQNGASAIIANAFSYVPLSDDELKRYFLEIADSSALPLCVYDNPVSTGQSLSHDLLKDLSSHSNIQSVKVLAKADNQQQHTVLRELNCKVGYAVDANCCEATIGGGSVWYSTLAGTAPELLVPIVRAIKQGDLETARNLNKRLAPLYAMMKAHSGYRVMHAIANIKGWQCSLPSPLTLPIIDGLSEFILDEAHSS